MNSDEWIEMTKLKRMNENEWMETNELKQMNLNTWIDMNELKGMNCQKWNGPTSFKIFKWNWALSLQSRAPSCWPHLQKVVRSCKFYDFYVKSSSLYSLVHILSTTFPDQGAHPRKQRPSTGDRGRPLYPKKTQGFAPESVFSREFTRSRSLTLRTYLQMLWLTSWCGSHDDVVDMTVWQLAVRIVRSSEVS